MAQMPWDVIIVGQGLAGTTLAWHLRNAGKRVLILDASEPVTSSKIAAGLITPITGQRLAISWNFDQFIGAAREFYKSIEQRTHRTFFHDRTALRFFRSDREQQSWSERAPQPDFQACLSNPQPMPLIDPAIAEPGAGGFAMQAAQLDVAAYLEASRKALDWEATTLDWQDVTFGPQSVSVQGHKTGLLISCEGYAASRNPYFSQVRFNAAKGDILTVRFDHPLPARTLHRGIWVAPTPDPDIFKIGSTYDRETLDREPDPSARTAIERQFQAFLKIPYMVLNHQAAVRPIISESQAVVGLHPEEKRLGYFNGLGSKGALHAPWYAKCLADHLMQGTPMPHAVDVARHFTP